MVARAFVMWGLASFTLGAAGCSGPSAVGAGSPPTYGSDSGSSSGGDGGGSGGGPSPRPDGGSIADSGPRGGDASASGDGASGQVAVPTPVGACPTFQNGTVTFQPAAGSRTVQLYLDPSTLSKHGPLVLYWYATLGSPAQATEALGAAMQTIESLGGIVAAPADNGTGQFPWIDNVAAHMLLADEIVGCAVAAGIDATRIHALGFSAGALMTTQLAFGRSSYLASVATY